MPQSRAGSPHQKRPPSILRQASIPREDDVNEEEGVVDNEQRKKLRQNTGKEMITTVGPSKGSEIVEQDYNFLENYLEHLEVQRIEDSDEENEEVPEEVFSALRFMDICPNKRVFHCYQ